MPLEPPWRSRKRRSHAATAPAGPAGSDDGPDASDDGPDDGSDDGSDGGTVDMAPMLIAGGAARNLGA